jgi:hypothetical protein
MYEEKKYHSSKMADKSENDRGRDSSKVIGCKVDGSTYLLLTTAPDNSYRLNLG